MATSLVALGPCATARVESAPSRMILRPPPLHHTEMATSHPRVILVYNADGTTLGKLRCESLFPLKNGDRAERCEMQMATRSCSVSEAKGRAHAATAR